MNGQDLEGVKVADPLHSPGWGSLRTLTKITYASYLVIQKTGADTKEWSHGQTWADLISRVGGTGRDTDASCF